MRKDSPIPHTPTSPSANRRLDHSSCRVPAEKCKAADYVDDLDHSQRAKNLCTPRANERLMLARQT
jgi:hypothetical protein